MFAFGVSSRVPFDAHSLSSQSSFKTVISDKILACGCEIQAKSSASIPYAGSSFVSIVFLSKVSGGVDVINTVTNEIIWSVAAHGRGAVSSLCWCATQRQPQQQQEQQEQLCTAPALLLAGLRAASLSSPSAARCCSAQAAASVVQTRRQRACCLWRGATAVSGWLCCVPSGRRAPSCTTCGVVAAADAARPRGYATGLCSC